MYEPKIFEPSTLFDSWDGAIVDELKAEDRNALQEVKPAKSHPEARTFELPTAIWGGMVACYAIFFFAIGAALNGSGVAMFMVAISIGYTAIYFGSGMIISSLAGIQERSPLDNGKPLQTWTGPMGAKAVYGQILIVPIAVAFFGAAAALIIFWTF